MKKRRYFEANKKGIIASVISLIVLLTVAFVYVKGIEPTFIKNQTLLAIYWITCAIIGIISMYTFVATVEWLILLGNKEYKHKEKLKKIDKD